MRFALPGTVGLVSLLLAVYPLVIELRAPIVALGVTGVVCVGAGLALVMRWLTWMGACMLALQYGVALVARAGGIDVAAPLVGASLLLLFELTDLVLLGSHRAVERATLRRSLVHALVVTAAGALAATLAVGLRTSVSLGYPVALVAGGLLGVLALIVPVRLALRAAGQSHGSE